MKILCVGAGGAGMAWVVRWHLALEDEVFVCDDVIGGADLMKRYPGAHAWHVADGGAFDRAVFSDAVPAGHPVRAFAMANGIAMHGLSRELGLLSAGRNLVAVCGTHGKSTTTALLAWVLAAAGKDPLCAVGADIVAWSGGFRYGAGPVVIEADEYRKHFLDLSPTTVLVTSLEMDHFDTYENEDVLLDTFAELCEKPSVRSVAVAAGWPLGERLGERIAKNGTAEVVRFGGEHDRFRVMDVRRGEELSQITALLDGVQHDFEIKSAACPHLGNLVGVIVVLHGLGVGLDEMKEGIATFPGIGRRLERIGEMGNARVYSDFAHHPTAVRETLRVAHEIWPKASICVVFEPHERLRTSRLRDEYAQAFSGADGVALLPIYDPIGRERRDIADGEANIPLDGKMKSVENYAAASAWMRKFAEENADALIIVMGAGPVDGNIRSFLAHG